MTLSYAEALRQVKDKVTASKTSFGAGMAVLPKDRREGMYALYAFCRAVDDIADESPTPQIAAKGLQDWRRRISDVFKGTPTGPITTVLRPAIEKFGLIEKDFQEIIDGMEMDSVEIIAPDMKTLDLYCDRVASAVGRASVRIFGTPGADGDHVAFHLGRALQLTNILRDLKEDAKRNRLYLPQELLEKHEITSRIPAEVIASPALPIVCRELAEVAQNHYIEAKAYMRLCPAKAIRPARIMRNYYHAILKRLIKSGWKDLDTRVSLSSTQKLLLVLKGSFAS